MPIQQIDFKTSAFTGTGQRETLGEGLAKVLLHGADLGTKVLNTQTAMNEEEKKELSRMYIDGALYKASEHSKRVTSDEFKVLPLAQKEEEFKAFKQDLLDYHDAIPDDIPVKGQILGMSNNYDDSILGLQKQVVQESVANKKDELEQQFGGLMMYDTNALSMALDKLDEINSTGSPFGIDPTSKDKILSLPVNSAKTMLGSMTPEEILNFNADNFRKKFTAYYGNGETEEPFVKNQRYKEEIESLINHTLAKQAGMKEQEEKRINDANLEAIGLEYANIKNSIKDPDIIHSQEQLENFESILFKYAPALKKGETLGNEYDELRDILETGYSKIYAKELVDLSSKTGSPINMTMMSKFEQSAVRHVFGKSIQNALSSKDFKSASNLISSNGSIPQDVANIFLSNLKTGSNQDIVSTLNVISKLSSANNKTKVMFSNHNDFGALINYASSISAGGYTDGEIAVMKKFIESDKSKRITPTRYDIDSAVKKGLGNKFTLSTLDERQAVSEMVNTMLAIGVPESDVIKSVKTKYESMSYLTENKSRVSLPPSWASPNNMELISKVYKKGMSVTKYKNDTLGFIGNEDGDIQIIVNPNTIDAHQIGLLTKDNAARLLEDEKTNPEFMTDAQRAYLKKSREMQKMRRDKIEGKVNSWLNNSAGASVLDGSVSLPQNFSISNEEFKNMRAIIGNREGTVLHNDGGVLAAPYGIRFAPESVKVLRGGKWVSAKGITITDKDIKNNWVDVSDAYAIVNGTPVKYKDAYSMEVAWNKGNKQGETFADLYMVQHVKEVEKQYKKNTGFMFKDLPSNAKKSLISASWNIGTNGIKTLSNIAENVKRGKGFEETKTDAIRFISTSNKTIKTPDGKKELISDIGLLHRRGLELNDLYGKKVVSTVIQEPVTAENGRVIPYMSKHTAYDYKGNVLYTKTGKSLDYSVENKKLKL